MVQKSDGCGEDRAVCDSTVIPFDHLGGLEGGQDFGWAGWSTMFML